METCHRIRIIQVGGKLFAPPVFIVPAHGDTIKLLWHGPAEFKVSFDESNCPFAKDSCVLTAVRVNNGNVFETPAGVIADSAKVNKYYEYKVLSEGQVADPIIIIRTIQYFEAVEDQSSISEIRSRCS